MELATYWIIFSIHQSALINRTPSKKVCSGFGEDSWQSSASDSTMSWKTAFQISARLSYEVNTDIVQGLGMQRRRRYAQRK